ncbi:MarR family winged helix-turn-helix transcriptional regulator [Agromyces sp. Soil535]|uniref:MarR family winged helix-turn-helix transcriptional regulator n=1 Tax=Agromyces sp. Soil535 TaxID=1736390 RepID=UPI000AD78DB1|nr:MarR family winged helix-turn-helix transcriptional regulator [Agromyces sp. Soil535]
MSDARQDPVTAIEAALVTMRRDQGRRRLQRRAAGLETGWKGEGPRRPDDRGPRGGQGLADAARFRLLDALEGAERPPSVSELADVIAVDQPRASRLVQAAVEAGHVRREVDSSDARRSAIVLTASGRAILDSARENRRSAVETALAGFTSEETADFARLLARFVAEWPRG